MNTRKLSAFLLLLTLSQNSMQAKSKARLYDLKNGTVTEFKFTRSAWGSVYGSVIGTGGYQSSYHSGRVDRRSNQMPGEAVLVGAGEVVTCEFLASMSSGHGSGGCRDKEGNLYKLMF